MRFLALWKVLVFVFPLIGGKPVSQVLGAAGLYPHAYVVQPQSVYVQPEASKVIDYYDTQDPHEDTIVYDYIEDTPVKSNYEFAYGVSDDKHGTAYSRKESSDGKGTKGQYQVNLPDGRVQTVIYSADEHGYRAQVLYEGEAVHDEPHPNAIPHPPIKKLKKEQEVHVIKKVHDDGHNTIYRSPHNDHSPHQHQHHHPHHLHHGASHAKALSPAFGHAHNSIAHGLPHVTDFPFSPVGPSSVPLGHHPFVTAPFHSTVPHPHPIIQTHGHHALPQHASPNFFHSSAVSAYPQIHPIINGHGINSKQVIDPAYRREILAGSDRFTRGTDYEDDDDSTASPIVENEEE